ncbi:putative ABC transport system ATP-binding protein [Sinomicrobium oceani]|uniref:Putative ABC transport system ATP-binding protein n=1 Tax=Sinomicrobium oceani TaxID=1150368 RepID=A0A1K1RUB4_9FLAO|nr:ATP-binding cassette domain-containing protein [Sinomicrobium oceani]SFW75649.1 putative ABC transport system ATP-binding protein [Sinomicrobium oceani]
MIATKNLRFSYDEEHYFTFPDIVVSKKGHLLILGDSGVGKTTFLHLLAGLLKPGAGEIKIGDTDIARLSHRKLDKFRGRHIGIVFQKAQFIRALTVEENLLLIQNLSGTGQDKKRVREILERLHIGHKAAEKVSNLSEGQKQRVSIAAALVNNPDVILTDEPTSSLDDKNCAVVTELLKEQAAQTNASLVVITHDHRLASQFSNSIRL